MNGVHCHVSPMITAARARTGVCVHEKSSNPSATHSGATGPCSVSVIMRNRNPMPTGVTIIGSRNTIRKKRFPRRFWVTSKARPSPSKNWTMTPTKTKVIVTTSVPGSPPFKCVMTMSQISPNVMSAVRTPECGADEFEPIIRYVPRQQVDQDGDYERQDRQCEQVVVAESSEKMPLRAAE